MKHIIFTLFLLIGVSCAFADLPPTRMAGQGGVLAPAFNIYTPKNQVTNLGGVNKRIETGNSNILANSSFEAAVAAESWTSTSGTLTNVTADTVDGLKYAQVALTAQVLNFSQITATSASLVGLQAEASVYVMAPSTVNNLQLCAKVNSADTLTCSDTFSGTDSWQLKTIPFVLGSTNNGLVLKTTGVATGNIAIDNARLVIGDVKNTSSVVTAWQSYTPDFTGFGTTSSHNIKYRQSGQSLEISGTFVGGTSTGVEARISLPTGFTGSSQLSALEFAKGYINNTAVVGRYSAMLIEPNAAYLTISYQDNSTGGYFAKANANAMSAGGTHSFFASFPVNELAGNVTTITQPISDKETWYLSQLGSALTENSDDIRFGLGGTITIYKGSDVSTSTALINNSSGNMYALDEASGGQRTKFIANKNVTVTASWAAGINGASIIALNVNDARLIWGSEASSGSQIRMVSASFDLKPGEFFSASTQSGASVTAGANPVFLSFTSALKNPSITGNFVNTMNTSSGFAEKFFSAKISSTGVVSNEIGDFLDGNCSHSTGEETCNFKSGVFTTIPNCTGVVDLGTGSAHLIRMSTNITRVRVETLTTGLAYADEAKIIFCHGY